MDAVSIEQLESNIILELVKLLINDNILIAEIKNHSSGIVNLYGVEKLAESIEKLC